MATERDLIAAICANPDEDTPRLAYADWLEEEGNPDRAAFIRLQIDRANNPDAVPSPDEGADYDRLHRSAWDSWLPPLPAWATDPRFERGFVEQITCSPEDFISRADELFAAAPIRRVRFHSASLPTRDLAHCPHLRRVRSFGLGSAPLTPDDVRTLFGSPHLGEVRELWGGRNDLASDEALKVLAGCPALASLRTLYLGGGTVTADGLAALTGSSHIRGLRSLTLSSAGIGDAGARALAAWPGLRTVTHLHISNSGIGPDGVEALTASPNLGTLARLSLSSNRIEERGAAVLGRCERLRTLRELNLTDCEFRKPEWPALFGVGVFAGLRSLYLGSNSLWGEGAAALAAAPLGELHTLNLEYCSTRAETLTALAAAPWFRTVQNLNLSGNKFGPAGMAALAAAPLDGVRVLDLSENSLGDEGAAILAVAPWLRGVRQLSVTDNDIGKDGAVALANSPHLANLEDLCIDDNFVGVAGVRALLDSPTIPPHITLRPGWGWDEEDQRAELLAKYGDRVLLPDPRPR